MLKLLLCIDALALVAFSNAQFVYPKVEDHEQAPGVYYEDPFITHYRKEFFAVFAGDYPRFEKAYKEIQGMVAKNPKDARAVVWLGNGQTIEAGLLQLRGKKSEAIKLLAESRKTMDRAVALRPKDPNIYMMQAATLYIQGQYWPGSQVPRVVWLELRDDCRRLIGYLGPKMTQMSAHVRGETYGELGVAYKMLGDAASAKKAFLKIVELDPGTDYEAKAKAELQKLDAVPAH